MMKAVRAVFVDHDLEYIAGIFDGEGHAGVSFGRKIKNGKIYNNQASPQIAISMLDREPIDLTCKVFDKQIMKLNKAGKISYTFRVSHRQALEVAKILIKYTRMSRRKDQLQSIIDHYEQFDLEGRTYGRNKKCLRNR